jgi:hypothetical protein
MYDHSGSPGRRREPFSVGYKPSEDLLTKRIDYTVVKPRCQQRNEPYQPGWCFAPALTVHLLDLQT